MTAPQPPRNGAVIDINQLRTGSVYRATTSAGASVGEYLGMEAPHGDRSILLRHAAGTASIAIADVTAIHPEAA